MSAGPHRPFVSVKFSPVGRTYSFLIPELALDNEGSAAGSGGERASIPPPSIPFSPGDAVVVQTSEGRALGTVTRSVNELASRKCPPAESELALRQNSRPVLEQKRYYLFQDTSLTQIPLAARSGFHWCHFRY